MFGISLNNPRHAKQKNLRICTSEQFRNQVRATGMVVTNKEGCGIPQGSPISALLSNIYMIGFDAAMQAYATKQGGSYRRYCDDILLVLPQSKETSAIAKVKKPA